MRIVVVALAAVVVLVGCGPSSDSLSEPERRPRAVPVLAASEPDLQRAAYVAWRAEFDRLIERMDQTGEVVQETLTEYDGGRANRYATYGQVARARNTMSQVALAAANLTPSAALDKEMRADLIEAAKALSEAVSTRQQALEHILEFLDSPRPSVLFSALQKVEDETKRTSEFITRAAAHVARVEMQLGLLQPKPARESATSPLTPPQSKAAVLATYNTNLPAVDPKPPYAVVAKEDVSHALATRLVYRVVVPPDSGAEEIQRAAEHLIKEVAETRPVNAIGVFVYDDRRDVDGLYTLAMAEWAPQGDWGSAAEVEAGDYSTHELVMSFEEKALVPEGSRPSRTAHKPPPAPVAYDVVGVGEWSNPTRHRINIMVPSGVTPDFVERAIRQAVDVHSEIQGEPTAALQVYAYSGKELGHEDPWNHLPDTPLAIGVWAPNGRWDDAGTVDPGDYSRHKLVIEFME